MISLEEIDKTIMELENRDTTYAVCERLAWLYIVKDHISPTYKEARVLSTIEESEFMNAVNGKDINSVLLIIDKHMSELKYVFPKEYDLILNRIYMI